MKKLSGVVAALVVVSLSGTASAAKPGPVTEFDATVAAADSSVLSNDGQSVYTGRDVAAELTNYEPGDERRDSFYFRPQQKRHISFQHPDVADGRLVSCAWAGYLTFTSFSSGSTWWEEVQEAGSTLGDATIQCWESGSADSPMYHVTFPGNSQDGDTGECVTFTKTGETTYSIQAEPYTPGTTGGTDTGGGGSDPGTGIDPIDETLGGNEGEEEGEDSEGTPASGCPATVTEYYWEKGGWVAGTTAADVSAPFVLELTAR